MNKPWRAPFCAALIAGGKSTRMGRDKRLIELSGRPLWLRQLELLRSLQPDELLISGEEDGPWKDTGQVIVPDAMPDAGPLAGILSVLTATRSPHVLVLAVDLPLMTPDFLRAMLNRCTNSCGVVPSHAGRFEPLAAVYSRNCLGPAARQMHDRDGSLQCFVRGCIRAGLLNQVEISAKELRLFRNLNTPEDLDNGLS